MGAGRSKVAKLAGLLGLLAIGAAWRGLRIQHSVKWSIEMIRARRIDLWRMEDNCVTLGMIKKDKRF